MQAGQEDRNLGMIAHGLVALTGLGSLLSLGPVGLLASIASVVLYFVWKSKSPFVVRHAKQAAGLQVVLFLLGIVLAILGSIGAAGAVAAGSIGGAVAFGGLILILALAMGIVALVFGIMGLLKAQKGEEYTYPIVGKFIDSVNI